MRSRRRDRRHAQKHMTPDGKQRRRHMLIIAGLATLVYLNTMDNALHLDDFYRVKDNPGVVQFWPPWRHFYDPGTMATLPNITNYRPMLPLSLSVSYLIGRGTHVGWHSGNLVIQIVAALLVYLLCLELLGHWSSWCSQDPRRSQLALGVGLVFAIHPVSGIVVNYVCSRDLSLMQVFFLASFLTYVRIRRLGGTVGRWSWALLSLALAMLSKTNAALMPAFTLLFDFVVARDRPWHLRPYLRAAAFAAVVFAYFFYTKHVLNFSDIETLPQRNAATMLTYGLTQAKLHLFQYMANFVWPIPIRLGPGVEMSTGFGDVRALLGLAFIAATLVGAVVAWRHCPLLSFSILAYWLLIAPESSIIPMFQPATHYRPYPGSPFLFLAVGLVACQYVPPRALRRGFYLLLAYLVATALYVNTTWRTEKSAWGHSVKYGGDALAYLNYALCMDDVSERLRLLEEALRLSPGYVVARVNYGLALMDAGQTGRGLAEVEKAVATAPNWPQPRAWLAEAYSRLGRYKDAARESAHAARLEPRNADFLYRAARDAQTAGDVKGSLEFLNRLIAFKRDYKDALFLYGFALQTAGDRQGAVAAYREFLAAHPDHDGSWWNLGFVLKDLGDWQAAAEAFEKAVRARPQYYREGYRHLADCYQRLGDPQRAAAARAKYEDLRGQ